MTTPPAKVELLTARMALRPVGLDDLGDFHRIVTSPGVHEGTLTFPEHPDKDWSRARMERVMERVDTQECYFIHAHLLDDPAAGAIANLSLDIVRSHARGHLGYMVDQRHRGQGYATEMLTAVVEHAFDGLGLHRVCANTWTWNDASSKLLARVGFAREGRSRQHYLKDDEYIDADDWGMLASDPRPWKD